MSRPTGYFPDVATVPAEHARSVTDMAHHCSVGAYQRSDQRRGHLSGFGRAQLGRAEYVITHVIHPLAYEFARYARKRVSCSEI